jgi:hypothetical protein
LFGMRTSKTSMKSCTLDIVWLGRLLISPGWHGRRRLGRLLATLAGVFSAAMAGGQSAHVSAIPDTPSISAPSETARQWAVDCAKNEVLVIRHPDSYLRYRLHEVDEKGDTLRDQIETPQGSVARLIQRDGRPLTPDEDASERDRLQALLDSPGGFARHIRREDDNRTMGVKLLKMMPDAMIWSYAEGQPQLPNQTAGAPALVVLDFKPDPKWSAPNMEADPLTALQGRVWVEPNSRRMVRMEGTLFHAVNIGWGMVAHVYPGGTVTLEQTHAGGERWVVQHIVEQLTLRALMVKTVKQRLVFDTASYQAVPAMTYQQAIKMLLDTPTSGR